MRTNFRLLDIFSLMLLVVLFVGFRRILLINPSFKIVHKC